MGFTKQQVDEGVAVISMARGKANPLNDAFVGELLDILAQARSSNEIRALVLASDVPGFFCAGLDTDEVFAYDREAMHSFFGRFMDLYQGISCHPKPIVAAINGHAYAGGAVLALACDARILTEGTYRFALNEVRLGVTLPMGVTRLAFAAVGMHHGRRMVLTGSRYSPEQALKIGLADNIVPPDDLMPTAVACARELAQIPARAFAATKRMIAEETLFPQGSDRAVLESFLDRWFSEEATQHKQALVQSLRK